MCERTVANAKAANLRWGNPGGIATWAELSQIGRAGTMTNDWGQVVPRWFASHSNDGRDVDEC
jgi:hypothetical protein